MQSYCILTSQCQIFTVFDPFQIECLLKEYYTKHDTWKKTGVQVEFFSHEDPFSAPSEASDRLPLAAVNDCLYRARALGYHFVVSGDFDEINFPNFTRYKPDSDDGALVEVARNLTHRHPGVAGWHLRVRHHFLLYPDGYSEETKKYMKKGELVHSTPSFGLDPKTPLKLRTIRKTLWNTTRVTWPKVLARIEYIKGAQTHLVQDTFQDMTTRDASEDDVTCRHYRTSEPTEVLRVDDKEWYKRAQLDTSALMIEKEVYQRIERLIKALSGKCGISNILWDKDD